jgi:hypothetical protein
VIRVQIVLASTRTSRKSAVGVTRSSGTTNFWMGSTGSTVEVSLDGAAPVEAVRTQHLQGESVSPERRTQTRRRS